jgi:hypothetical protein
MAFGITLLIWHHIGPWLPSCSESHCSPALWPLRTEHLMPNAIWHHPVHLASHWTMACQWFRVTLFPGLEAPENRAFDAKCHLASPCLFGITLDGPWLASGSESHCSLALWPLRTEHLMPNAIWHHPAHLASHWSIACWWFRVTLFPCGP